VVVQGMGFSEENLNKSTNSLLLGNKYGDCSMLVKQRLAVIIKASSFARQDTMIKTWLFER